MHHYDIDWFITISLHSSILPINRINQKIDNVIFLVRYQISNVDYYCKSVYSRIASLGRSLYVFSWILSMSIKVIFLSLHLNIRLVTKLKFQKRKIWIISLGPSQTCLYLVEGIPYICFQRSTVLLIYQLERKSPEFIINTFKFTMNISCYWRAIAHELTK